MNSTSFPCLLEGSSGQSYSVDQHFWTQRGWEAYNDAAGLQEVKRTENCLTLMKGGFSLQQKVLSCDVSGCPENLHSQLSPWQYNVANQEPVWETSDHLTFSNVRGFERSCMKWYQSTAWLVADWIPVLCWGLIRWHTVKVLCRLPYWESEGRERELCVCVCVCVWDVQMCKYLG